MLQQMSVLSLKVVTIVCQALQTECHLFKDMSFVSHGSQIQNQLSSEKIE